MDPSKKISWYAPECKWGLLNFTLNLWFIRADWYRVENLRNEKKVERAKRKGKNSLWLFVCFPSPFLNRNALFLILLYFSFSSQNLNSIILFFCALLFNLNFFVWVWRKIFKLIFWVYMKNFLRFFCEKCFCSGLKNTPILFSDFILAQISRKLKQNTRSERFHEKMKNWSNINDAKIRLKNFQLTKPSTQKFQLLFDFFSFLFLLFIYFILHFISCKIEQYKSASGQQKWIIS